MKLGLVTGLAALLVPLAASADEVVLRNGTVEHGAVTEMIAYDHVTIVLPNGETARIAWAEVERVVTGDRAPYGPPLAPDDSHVHVHFTASDTAYLYRAAAGTSDFETVCHSPCDIDLPLDGEYRVGGNGAPTKPLTLRGEAGGTTSIHVDGRNRTAMAGGVLLMALGSVVSLAGTATGTDQYNQGAPTRMLVFTALGAATLITGIILYVRGASSDITQHVAGAQKQASVHHSTWQTLSSFSF